MPRRPRQQSWKPITLTISDEVATALRIRAAIEGVELGAIADRILRATLASVIDQVQAMKGDLPTRPLALDDASAAPQPATTCIPTRSKTKSTLANQTIDPPIEDKDFRAECEASFLDEALAHAHHQDWESFIESLKEEDALAQEMGRHLIHEDSMEDEIESWVTAKRVPTRWKERLFFVLGGGTTFFPSIFGADIEPDEFFEWEQLR